MTDQQDFMGVTEVHRVTSEAMKLPHAFEGFDNLQPTTRQLLQVLEARSFYNNGDTKISDTRLAKVLGKSVKTVVRHMKKLEDRKFIARATKRHSGSSDKCGSRNDFFSLRVIRCLRIAVYSGGVVKTTRDLGWRNDVRPPGWFVPVVPEKYKPKKSEAFHINPHTLEWEEVPVPVDQNAYMDMYQDDVLDVDLHDNVRKYEYLRDMGDARGIDVLGYKKKTEEN